MADYDFTLPALGADMERATIIEWRVASGDHVERGDIVAIIDTEKSEIELEIWHGGTVREILVDAGEEVPVGAVLARLTGVDDLLGALASSAPSRGPAEASARRPPRGAIVRSPLVRHLAEERGIDLEAVQGTGPGGLVTRRDVDVASAEQQRRAAVVLASPRARRLADERGVALAGLTGTGPAGAILAADVPRSTSSPGRTPAMVRADSMRRTLAALMARSKREIPHYYLAQEIDMSAAMEWLGGTNAERPPAERLLPVALLLKATATAAARHREFNGFWIEDHLEVSEKVHLGVAVALRSGGLVAPAILDAEDKPVTVLMSELRDLVARARAGRLRGAEMSSPTITVTSLGDRGPDLVHGVIYPPQVALVGFGRIIARPMVLDGAVVARPVVTATLAGDHRATDGDRGARMLATIDRVLQSPEDLEDRP